MQPLSHCSWDKTISVSFSASERCVFKYTVSTPKIIVMFIMFHSSLIKDMTWITQDIIEFSRCGFNSSLFESWQVTMREANNS